MTLFTYDFSIENFSCVLDLFFVEGFKSLIKIALAILNHINEEFSRKSRQEVIESLVLRLKHFSDEIKPTSVDLLKES